MFDAIDFKWNDEEKEAIETLSIKAVTSKAECEDYPNCICLKKDLLLILKLIENQQAEIEKLKKHNKELLRKLKNRVKEVKKLTKYSLYKKEFAKLNREIEKKNEIIDEMAGYIATLDIEEDICSKTENEHCDKMNFGECEDCIKQYFKNKVEE